MCAQRTSVSTSVQCAMPLTFGCFCFLDDGAFIVGAAAGGTGTS